MQEDNCVFELTYNWGKEDGYSKGDAYAQVRPPASTHPCSAAAVRRARFRETALSTRRPHAWRTSCRSPQTVHTPRVDIRELMAS